MGKLSFCGIVPHPPILVPEVGKGDEEKISSTMKAMDNLATKLKETNPELLVVISPHGSVFQDGIAINGSPRLKGNLAKFGVPQIALEYENDEDFIELLIKESSEVGVLTLTLSPDMAESYGVSPKLDHGVIVPMYFLDKAGLKLPMVMVSMSMLPPLELYKFGLALQKAVENYDKRVAVIASGDLSHRLTHSAPAGYAPEGKILDEKMVQAIKEFDVPALVNLDPVLAEKGGECGWRSFLMMLGSLDGYEVNSEVLSYEGPFGVGYMVAALIPGQPSEEKKLLNQFIEQREQAVNKRREGESDYVKLARETLENKVIKGETISPPEPLPEEFREKAGVFVSLKKHGQLRGCIGTILPTTDSLAEEIINNAISAGIRDPRFAPVEPEELDDLVYSVDVLKKPEPIEGMDELDPHRYGVIVRNGHRSGLLLPNLEGIDTAKEQVAIARQKAGIGPDEPIKLERFEVIRYH